MNIAGDIFGTVLRAGVSAISRNRVPMSNGILKLPELETPVEIYRDPAGVPHIFAQNNHDLFLAQGFIHAQERFWQMELNRRTARGLLSELFGEIALDTDRAARTFGFDRLGKKDWENADEEIRQVVMAYTDGVNAFLQFPTSKMPVEFTLLQHHPSPWTIEDTMAFSRLMFWQLSHAWYGEITRAKLIEKVGEEHAAEWDIHYPRGNPCVLPEGIEFNLLNPGGNLKGLKGPFLDRGKGSNAWAIAGWRSQTGKPYLCNDMHLILGIPGIWFENHLVSNSMNITGVSIPAAPLILAGHNEHIAWGITLAFIDCEDLYVEKFDPQNPEKYQFRDQWLDANSTTEIITVKGRKQPHIEIVKKTHHGPIISDVVGHPEQRLAVQSMALQPCSALQGWMRLNQARHWNEFVTAMHDIEAPQLNIAYADVEGNIGYWVTGRVPIRAKGNGMVPSPGWDGTHEWIGEIPFEDMPHALNPGKGYIVSCNNKIISDNYPYYLGSVWMNGYRANRLSQMIEAVQKMGPDDFHAMQTDVTCIPGGELVAQLSELPEEDPDVKLAMKYLKPWDNRLTTDSIAGSFYEVIRYTTIRNLLEPIIGISLTNELLGIGFNPVLFACDEFYGSDTPALLRMLKNPSSWWVQQAGGKNNLLINSIKQSVEWLRRTLGDNPENWQWGKLHTITLAHAMGVQKPLDHVFNRGPYPIGGDTDTPLQTAMSPDDPYQNKLWAPSVRHIFDLGNFANSSFVLPSGQSGHVGSPHYDNMIDAWLSGEYYPMYWNKSDIEKHAVAKLKLGPRR